VSPSFLLYCFVFSLLSPFCFILLNFLPFSCFSTSSFLSFGLTDFLPSLLLCSYIHLLKFSSSSYSLLLSYISFSISFRSIPFCYPPLSTFLSTPRPTLQYQTGLLLMKHQPTTRKKISKKQK
jgi:hypothetical protein